MSVPGSYDGPSISHFSRARSFDDSDPYFGNNKQAGRTCALPDGNVLKSIAADNVKASYVAKIKVVVCAFCFLHFDLLSTLFWLAGSSLSTQTISLNWYHYLQSLSECSSAIWLWDKVRHLCVVSECSPSMPFHSR